MSREIGPFPVASPIEGAARNEVTALDRALINKGISQPMPTVTLWRRDREGLVTRPDHSTRLDYEDTNSR